MSPSVKTHLSSIGILLTTSSSGISFLQAIIEKKENNGIQILVNALMVEVLLTNNFTYKITNRRNKIYDFLMVLKEITIKSILI